MSITILSCTGKTLYVAAAADVRAAVTEAVKSGVYLREADLDGADDVSAHPLYAIRQDFFAVLDTAPREVPALREALVTGKVNGSTYHGSCACLVGTIANAQGVSIDSVPGLSPDDGRAAERWFLPIREGDQPVEGKAEREGQYRAAAALRWLDEWTVSRMALVAALSASCAGAPLGNWAA